MSSIVCPFIMHKLSNWLFFRLINANKIECIKPDTFSGLASLNLLWVFYSENIFPFQLFSDENFWVFSWKLDFWNVNSLIYYLSCICSQDLTFIGNTSVTIWYVWYKKLCFHCNVVPAQSKYNEIWIIHCLPGRSMTTTSKLYRMALSPTWLLYKHCE